MVHLAPFDFLSGAHCGQYHFPLGFEVRPTHWKWNHSIGHWREGRGEGGGRERKSRKEREEGEGGMLTLHPI